MTVSLREIEQAASVPVLPIFHLHRTKTGGIPEHDMFNTFNMGVGMVRDRRACRMRTGRLDDPARPG